MEYSQFVMSLGRLYKEAKIEVNNIDKLLKDGKINKEEYEYIISLRKG